MTITEKVKYYFENISRIDHRIEAWEEIFSNWAMEKAEDVENKKVNGSLSGLIVGIKDIYNMKGRAPRNGSAIRKNVVPKENATLVEKLLKEDAIIIGTTKLTEYCYFRPTTTRNPHHPEHTPGGSSSGSAAAVAAGLADVTIGSQTKGSVIRPASFCGVYGFKPSLGAISTAGSTHLTTTMDHPGIFAKDPADINRVFEALIGYDGKDSQSCYLPDESNADLKNIGYIDLRGETEISGDMTTAFNSYLTELRGLGYSISEAVLPAKLEEIESIWQGIFYPEVYDQLGHLKKSNDYDLLGEEIREVVEIGEKKSIDTYFHSLNKRKELQTETDKLLQDYDIILLPSAKGAATKGLDSTGDPICTVFTSLLGIPSVNIPVGVNEDGLPLGLQAVGRKFSDKQLLSFLSELPANKIQSPS